MGETKPLIPKHQLIEVKLLDSLATDMVLYFINIGFWLNN